MARQTHLEREVMNVSHFGRKCLHKNGVNDMVGLRANASVMARMVRKQWFGDPGLRSRR